MLCEGETCGNHPAKWSYRFTDKPADRTELLCDVCLGHAFEILKLEPTSVSIEPYAASL